MNHQQIVDIISQFLFMIAEISLPILAVALVVGLIVSIFQAATQINESTLSFLPKMVSIFIAIIVLSPWMMRKMDDYVHQVYEKIALVGRQK